MASDKQQFERATQKWERLQADKAFSVPRHMGRTAIVYSTFFGLNDEEKENDRFLFSKEADDLRKRLSRHKRRSFIVEEVTGDDMRYILTDPMVSSVVSIGHGALSYMYLDNGVMIRDGKQIQNDRFDWRDVAESADHLKTGIFTQRHCGNFSRRLSVPLGCFAMTAHHNVYAPVGQYFSVEDLQDPLNESPARRAATPVNLSGR